jgi:hypothetical protein
MSAQPITLKSFFCDEGTIASACEAELAEAALGTAAAKVPKPARPAAVRALKGSLDDIFNVGLGGVLESSWGKLAALKDSLEASLSDPDKLVLAPLLDHKVTSNHEPHIDLMLGGKSLTRLKFNIALSLQLKGVELEIRQGRIAGLRSGECLGEGIFSVGGQTLIQRETPALPLPGRVTFGPQ